MRVVEAILLAVIIITIAVLFAVLIIFPDVINNEDNFNE